MKIRKKIFSFVMATAISLSAMCTSASALTTHVGTYSTYVSGSSSSKIVKTVSQKRSGASGTYYYTLGYVRMKSKTSFLGNVSVMAGADTPSGEVKQCYSAISYRNGNMIVSEEDATKDTGIVWTDYLDCGKKNSGIVQVQGVFIRY